MEIKISKDSQIVLLIGIIAVSILFAVKNFLVQPSVWFDEAITIEIARNFAMFGTLDILTAPGVFSGVPYLVGTNGYPLTIPLAGFFQLFGFGLAEGRIFMLLWLVVVLGAVFYTVKKIFGTAEAFFGLGLIITFASFYASGTTVTGELPGFFFFVLGLYFLSFQRNYFFFGIFWGLAMAAKPGVYLLLAHTALIFVIVFEDRDRMKNLLKFGSGMFFPLAIWLYFAFPHSLSTFFSTVAYFLNPIDIPFLSDLIGYLPFENLTKGTVVPDTGDAMAGLLGNVRMLFTHSTLIYFSILSSLAALGYFADTSKTDAQKRFMKLSLVYGVLIMIYFLRGPGWIRYLLALELLLLVLVFPSINVVLRKVQNAFGRPRVGPALLSMFAVAALIIMQTAQLFFWADIPISSKALAVADTAKTFAEDDELIMGVFNVPEAAAFGDAGRTYQTIGVQNGLAPLGESPFYAAKKYPDIIILNQEKMLLDDLDQKILQDFYSPTQKFGEYEFYRLKTGILVR